MQLTNEALLTEEAKVFTQYLLGEEADQLTISLYIQAQGKLNITLTEKESKRLDFMLRYPSVIGMVDGAMALNNPESGIRKKIYVLFSILESNPRYARHFLPSNEVGLFSIILSGIRAVWNAITGFILLAWI
ncbi:MAG TPA: hypothetical protein VK783_08715 [Bacteroidia bacterium]|nr:hypothetical protein [Bacteroidia bacterium]